MNVQDIITLMIVIAAFAYAGFHLIKLFIPDPSASKAKCPGCDACDVKEDLVKNIHLN
jgi:hypothetical protein